MIGIRNELKTLLVSPVIWAIVLAYFIVSGIFFVALLFARQIADLESYFANIETTFVVLAPIIAMRSFAEERRTGSLDITLSWPISRWKLVVVKFVSNTLLSWAIVSIVWIYVWILAVRAPIEVGKAAAGYLGLLMILMMFSAIALAISARASSPTSAAFVGFGVLLTIWILNFIPGWIGGRIGSIVAYLAPTSRVANTGRGILDLGDALYFIAGTALGLTLTAWWLKEPRARSLKGLLRGRYLGVSLGLVIVVGVGASSVAARGQLDLTPEKRFTLTEYSANVLRRVSAPISVYGFVEPGSAQQAEMQSLIRRYQLLKPDVELRFIDPDAQPAITFELGATTYGQMVVEVENRSELVDDILEIEVTSAIQRLSRITPPVACFTVGHGERDISDILPGGYLQFATRLQELGFTTKKIALAAEGGKERLTSCTVLILGGPRVEFLPEEKTMIDNYAANDGRLVVFADSSGSSANDQLNDMLRPWGVAVRPSLTYDRSSLKEDPGAIVVYRYPSNSPVTTRLARQDIPLLVIGAQPVENVLVGLSRESEAWLSPLISTSSRSWLEDETEGPFVLAIVADWSSVEGEELKDLAISRTRIGVVGTAELAANGYFERLGNADFATRLVAWVAREDDIINATRQLQGVPRVVLTEDDRTRIIYSGVVIPAIIPFLILIGALLRSRRG